MLLLKATEWNWGLIGPGGRRMKSRKSHRILRALSVLLLAGIMALWSAAGAESPDYAGIGLEAAGILSEMVQSSDYLSLFMVNEKATELLDTKFNTGDYDAPTAVYRLQPADPREWFRTLLPEAELEQLDSLSPVLQEQVYARMKGLTLMSNRINAEKGAEVLALTSTLQVLLNKPGLECEEQEYYLFIFEKGVPVLITYGWHQAVGSFLVLEKSETESAEALQGALEFYGVEVIPGNEKRGV